jgi:hypothetical protein
LLVPERKETAFEYDPVAVGMGASEVVYGSDDGKELSYRISAIAPSMISSRYRYTNS